MPINITMPALSPTMEEGNLAKWLVKEGDKVSPGDVIAEIETDKATMEVEAVDEGTVAKIVVPAGTEGVKVNALIAILARRRRGCRRGRPEAATPCRQGGGTEGRSAQDRAAKAEAAKPAMPPPRRWRVGMPPGKRTFASPLARRIAKDAQHRCLGDRRIGPARPRCQGGCGSRDRRRGNRLQPRRLRRHLPPLAAPAAPAPKAMSDEAC